MPHARDRPQGNDRWGRAMLAPWTLLSGILGKGQSLYWNRAAAGDVPMNIQGGFMVTFSYYWPFVRGIHRWPVDSPHKGQWRGALIFSLICAWTNGRVNNWDAGDLRRHDAHYDATVMFSIREGANFCDDLSWSCHDNQNISLAL